MSLDAESVGIGKQSAAAAVDYRRFLACRMSHVLAIQTHRRAEVPTYGTSKQESGTAISSLRRLVK